MKELLYSIVNDINTTLTKSSKPDLEFNTLKSNIIKRPISLSNMKFLGNDETVTDADTKT